MTRLFAIHFLKSLQYILLINTFSAGINFKSQMLNLFLVRADEE